MECRRKLRGVFEVAQMAALGQNHALCAGQGCGDGRAIADGDDGVVGGANHQTRDGDGRQEWCGVGAFTNHQHGIGHSFRVGLAPQVTYLLLECGAGVL